MGGRGRINYDKFKTITYLSTSYTVQLKSFSNNIKIKIMTATIVGLRMKVKAHTHG